MEITRIFELYDGEIPEHIVSIDLDGIELAYENIDGTRGTHRYNYEDVRKYYEKYSGDMIHSMREFGPMIGDHRQMDAFVQELHSLFMTLDPEGYRETYKDSFLEPNW